MRYRSTAGRAPLTSLRGAVLRGLAPDGGLYMPAEIARHSPEELEEFRSLPFTEVCFRVVRPFATPDVPEEVLWQIVSEAINFPVKLVSLSPGLHILELFHGPTLAFKDFGARFMARLMGYFVRGENRQLTVLVATSGDTGSAVAHGFLSVPGIRVVILYPSKRISEAQEKQFTTLGENIAALEVSGTFDDCQRLVKQAFCDEELNKRAFLTSANSINIGRLLPQMFYHVAAYRQLPVASTPLVVAVPSGNFGNLTAGLFAKRIGLPVAKFIAAKNANDVVPQYLLSGQYQPRAAQATCSNAMDVGNPNNFPRLLDLCRRWVPPLLSVSQRLGRLPRIGRILVRAMPVADYTGLYPLDQRQLEEWALLDTFDWLSPRYDQPQKRTNVAQWIEAAGFKESVVLKCGFMVVRGIDKQ